VQLEHWAAPQYGLPGPAAQDEPGTASPGATPIADRPTAGHLKVAAEHEAALEPQHEVLSDRFDALQAAPVELVGHAGRRRSRVRGLDLDDLPDEGLEPPGGPVERIAFGHAPDCDGEGSSSRRGWGGRRDGLVGTRARRKAGPWVA